MKAGEAELHSVRPITVPLCVLIDGRVCVSQVIHRDPCPPKASVSLEIEYDQKPDCSVMNSDVLQPLSTTRMSL